jgi:hypothetical protein
VLALVLLIALTYLGAEDVIAMRPMLSAGRPTASCAGSDFCLVSEEATSRPGTA